jgi:murein DD-endopeptidase MepM/ murein hydrolase activator NlpD
MIYSLMIAVFNRAVLSHHSLSDDKSLGHNVCGICACLRLIHMRSGFLRSYRTLTVLLMMGIVAMASSEQVAAATDLAARLSMANVANGQVTVLEIELGDLEPDAADLKARFGQHAIALFQHPVKPSGIYCGLVGIPLNAAPQKATIELEWTDSRGRQGTSVPVSIIDGKYRSEKLSVDPRHVKLSKKNLERVGREKKEIRRIYSSSSDKRLWYGTFKKPLDAQQTSVFGTRRLFNDQHQSSHRGIDFRAPIGTPVHASNSGVVRLAQNLFYSGNIVIVDHGNGIFTNYAHLSKIQVIIGQQIARGQQIGLSGDSGRVSGPHLHWGVRVSGVYVDPSQFLNVMSALLGS